MLPHVSKGRDPLVSNEAGARGHDRCQKDLPVLCASFQGLPNEVTEGRWLQTTEVCCLIGLEVGNLKSRCLKVHTRSETDRGSVLCCFFASNVQHS